MDSTRLERLKARAYKRWLDDQVEKEADEEMEAHDDDCREVSPRAGSGDGHIVRKQIDD